MLRARSVGRRNSTGVDEERSSKSSRNKNESTRCRGEGGGRGFYETPGSELRLLLGRREKRRAKMEEEKKAKKKGHNIRYVFNNTVNYCNVFSKRTTVLSDMGILFIQY